MGVFSHIYLYYWDTRSSVPVLYADKNLKTKINERLVGKEESNLIWIMSDCLSPSWESSHAFKSIEKWSKKSFTSIMQMFPKEMWMGTMLHKGKHAHFHSTFFNPLNNHLQSDRRRKKEGLKIPVISFNPYALQSWARVVVGSYRNIISGVMFENLDFEMVKIKNAREISAEMRLKRFYSQATATAQELAVYMSVLPVDFQVTRILQEVKLLKSDQSHVAEVYLGGLIEKTSLGNKVLYDFYEGVRDRLSVNIGADEAYELMQNMSEFVVSHLNVGIDFSALITDPTGAILGDYELDEQSIAFARLASKVLKRKGGIYAQTAMNIEKELSPNPSCELKKQETIDIANPEVNNKIWVDSDSNLMWQKDVEEHTYNWKEVYEYSNKLNSMKYAGFDDWRIPSIEELQSISLNVGLDNPHSKSNKTFIKKALLDSMVMSKQSFWTLSLNENNENFSLAFNFDQGRIVKQKKRNKHYVRGVRLGKKENVINDVLSQLKNKSWNDIDIVCEYKFSESRTVDILLKNENKKLAIIEIKLWNSKIDEEPTQVLDDAYKLNIDFIYITNGIKIYEYVVKEERGAFIDDYPNKEE
jgi:hypothetical protein